MRAQPSRGIDVDRRDFRRRDGRATFHQDFEPDAKTVAVELLVQARLVTPPQVEVEDGRQLSRRCQRHELAAILESAAVDDPVQHFGLEPRHDLCEVRRVQNAIEERTRVSNGARCRTRRAAPSDRGPFARAPAISRGDEACDEGISAWAGHDTGYKAQQTVLNGGLR